MPRFDDVLSAEDAENIRAALVAQATQAWQAQEQRRE
jgi:hypothetical protein